MKFYRYVRPVHFDNKRIELVTNPKGGVCLRFELQGDHLWFTHARCSSDEFFSKEVAKRCADVRSADAKKNGYVELGYCGRLVVTKRTDELLASTIAWASSWIPNVKEASVLYHAFELKELAADLETIAYANELQERLQSEWKSSMAAANYTQMYDNLS